MTSESSTCVGVVDRGNEDQLDLGIIKYLRRSFNISSGEGSGSE